ncbi:MAG TPA: alpha/beta hydrolase [Myxococcaceae bacterium]|nr:alpha/beta hydrolase [Myxococcaceae bacterium]
MKTPRAIAGLLALAGLATGCATSYAERAPLSFQDYDYSSPEGRPWPLKRLALEETAAAHGMPRAPEVAYVELNPEGGKTLVFVHGLGSYLKFWRYQLDAFAEQGYRVLAVDLPGYGKSDKPATFPYTMEAMADAVRELVHKTGAQRPILVGHSMGGQTALSYAIRYPEEPSALVLTSPAGFEKFSRREQAWFKRVFSTTLIKSSPEYNIWGSVRQNNFARWRPELDWLIEERVRVAKSPEFDAYAYANVRTVEGLSRNDFVRESLNKVGVPTLIIFGEEDRLIPNPFLHGGDARDIMSYGHANIRDSKLVGLERCGHTVQMDCPEEYNQQVLGFLKGLEAPAEGGESK